MTSWKALPCPPSWWALLALLLLSRTAGADDAPAPSAKRLVTVDRVQVALAVCAMQTRAGDGSRAPLIDSAVCAKAGSDPCGVASAAVDARRSQLAPQQVSSLDLLQTSCGRPAGPSNYAWVRQVCEEKSVDLQKFGGTEAETKSATEARRLYGRHEEERKKVITAELTRKQLIEGTLKTLMEQEQSKPRSRTKEITPARAELDRIEAALADSRRQAERELALVETLEVFRCEPSSYRSSGPDPLAMFVTPTGPGPSPCQSSQSLALPAEDLNALKRRCARADRAAGPNGLRSVVGVAALGTLISPGLEGLGDFIKARAKDDAMEFAVQHVVREVCEELEKRPQTKQLFESACQALFPNSSETRSAEVDASKSRLGGSFDLAAVTSGKLGKDLAADLRQLPGIMIDMLPLDQLPPDQLPDARALKIILKQLVVELMDLRKPAAGEPAEEYTARIFKRLDGAINGKLVGEAKPRCDFRTGAKPSAACGILLTIALGASIDELAEQLINPDGNVPVSGWLTTITKSFCTAYGPPPTAQTPEECILPGQVAETVKTIGAATFDFYQSMTGVVDRMEKLRKEHARPKDQAAAWVAAGEATAAFSVAILKQAETLGKNGGGKKDQDTLKKVRQSFEVSISIMKATSAGLNEDYEEMAKEIRLVFTSELLEDPDLFGKEQGIPPQVRKGIIFVLDLGTAKDRDQARKLIEDVAAPAGSYRAKYQRGASTIMLNAYLGAFGGGRVTGASGVNEKGESGGLFLVSAPVGVDRSWAIGSDSCLHGGFTLVAIDPLQLVPAGDKSQTADLRAVLTPGVLGRIGIFGSPFVLIGGVTYQPFQQSASTNCGTDGKSACWEGAVNFIAGLAVDVPLIQIR